MIKIKSYASSSKGNMYTLDNGKSKLMIECGLPIKKIKQNLNFKLHEISGCIITHQHLDHSKGINDLLKLGVSCFINYEHAKSLGFEHHNLKTVRADSQFNINEWTIKPFELVHDVYSLGFLLMSGSEKVLFITDSAYSPFKFNGLTHLMIECNYITEILNKNIAAGKIPVSMKNRLLFSHMSLETLLDFLKANDLSKLKEIHLTHLSDNNSNADYMKEAVQRLTGVQTYVCEE